MPPRARTSNVSPANNNGKADGKIDPKSWPSNSVPSFVKALSIDPAPFEAELVSPQILFELGEDDLVTLGVNYLQAKRLASEFKAISQGQSLEIDCGDPVSSAACTILLGRLEDEQGSVRASALALICALLAEGVGGGGKAEAAVKATVKTLMSRAEDPCAEVRVACLKGLAILATKGDAAVTALLVTSSSDADAGVRLAAVEGIKAVCVVKDRDLKLANRMLQRLEDSNAHVRKAAIDALSILPKDDVDILWGLSHKVEHGCETTRRAAALALPNLVTLGSDAGIRMVMQHMCDRDAGVREVAVATIKSGSILSKGNGASLSAVLQHVQHVYPATRQAALSALPYVCSEKDQSVISAIVVGLEDTDWAVRREAAICASLLGDRLNDRLVQSLQNLLEDEEKHVKDMAEHALAKLRAA